LPTTATRLAAYSLLGTGAALIAAAFAAPYALALPLFALAGACDGPLLTATLRIRADHAPPGAHAQVFTVGAGLKVTAGALGAALVGIGADTLPPYALLLGIAALQPAAAALLLTRGGSAVKPAESPSPQLEQTSRTPA
ncbi:MFS transporter, partial [Streptomyces sp. A7024]|nr:MFS transporter [Streptomyces coryli]